LLAPRLDREDHTKDIDFSADGIGRRWQAGYDYVRRSIEQKPWNCDVDALSGVLIHEVHPRRNHQRAKAGRSAAGSRL
jgi:NTE family protein